jgi:hypothetical protein
MFWRNVIFAIVTILTLSVFWIGISDIVLLIKIKSYDPTLWEKERPWRRGAGIAKIIDQIEDDEIQRWNRRHNESLKVFLIAFISSILLSFTIVYFKRP